MFNLLDIFNLTMLRSFMVIEKVFKRGSVFCIFILHCINKEVFH